MPSPNQNGKIVFANQAYCDLHSIAPHEMIGKSYTELVTPKSLPVVRRLYERRMLGEDSDTVPFREIN
ncbi:MAG: PAS domain-containing protein [Proteobacteria bacterium]|nr:PAS domain-containing protein [Pseudomonadota bacterium]